jgi:hypothetical protein
MIYFGVKQKEKSQHQAASARLRPVVGPNFNGLSLSGRF